MAQHRSQPRWPIDHFGRQLFASLEYYFGAVGGGLWKTTRRRHFTWFPVTDGQIRSSSVGAVAVAESNPDIVYLGHGRDGTARQHHARRRRV
jgi:hypothetical protein